MIAKYKYVERKKNKLLKNFINKKDPGISH